MISRAIRLPSDETPSYPSLLASDSAGAAARLSAAFAAVSPRIARHVPLRAILIYTAVFGVWLALTASAFLAEGLFAWSVGVVYLSYDTLQVVFVGTRIAHLLKRDPPALLSGYRATAAVVIAAWNEADSLPATIDALLAQDEPADIIVIADDGSDDATADVLRERYGLDADGAGALHGPARSHANLYWLRLPHAGKAAALNAALAQLETDVVVTVDADTLLAPNALHAMRDAFAADAKLVVAAGILTPVCGPTPTGRALQFFQRYEYIRNFMARYAWARIDALLLVSGAFAAFRRDALTAVGGFDRHSLVEDYELIHRLQRFSHEGRLDWRLRVIGDMRATTAAPDRIVTFLRQRRRWFAGFLQTQYWNADMTGNGRFGAVGRVMMPVKALDMLQPIYGLTALALLPVFVLTNRAALVLPAFGFMSAKIVFDFTFYVASIALYRRWTGDRAAHGGLWPVFAAIIEPFTFQPLRHVGATWGWISLLAGDLRWGRRGR